MKVAFITRSTLYTVCLAAIPYRRVQTAHQLTLMGVTAEIKRADEHINYNNSICCIFLTCAALPIFCIIAIKAGKPFVISTILCNYSEYDQHHRKGLGRLFKYLPADGVEYIKTIARYLLGRDELAAWPTYGKGSAKAYWIFWAGRP
jgi:hypothetical protein